MTRIPSTATLIKARQEFRDLLSVRTPERVWQRFFAASPYVLSLALPLRLLPCDIHPKGRPGKSEPDFLIYPGSERSRRLYGLIELKTPYSRVIKECRKKIFDITAHTRTAIRQLQEYDRNFDRYAPGARILGIGARTHQFIVMGSSTEMLELQATAEFYQQFEKACPRHIQLITFDDLLQNFERGCPKKVIVVVEGMILMAAPRLLERSSMIDEIIRLATQSCDTMSILERFLNAKKEAYWRTSTEMYGKE